MRAPKPEDWLIHRGNYQAWGYSSLDQINKANVKTLQLVWSRNMEAGANEATPLVYNGVMYLGNPGDVIQAAPEGFQDPVVGQADGQHHRHAQGDSQDGDETPQPVPEYRPHGYQPDQVISSAHADLLNGVRQFNSSMVRRFRSSRGLGTPKRSPTRTPGRFQSLNLATARQKSTHRVDG
jgi:hypothetical protein